MSFKGPILGGGFLSSEPSSFNSGPLFHELFSVPSLGFLKLVMYTNFFWDISWVVSVDTSSSIPELNSSIKNLGQLPVFSIQLTCSSWASSYFHFSSSSSGLSSCLLVSLLGFSSKNSSKLSQHIITTSSLTISWA